MIKPPFFPVKNSRNGIAANVVCEARLLPTHNHLFFQCKMSPSSVAAAAVMTCVKNGFCTPFFAQPTYDSGIVSRMQQHHPNTTQDHGTSRSLHLLHHKRLSISWAAGIGQRICSCMTKTCLNSTDLEAKKAVRWFKSRCLFQKVFYSYFCSCNHVRIHWIIIFVVNRRKNLFQGEWGGNENIFLVPQPQKKKKLLYLWRGNIETLAMLCGGPCIIIWSISISSITLLSEAQWSVICFSVMDHLYV